MTETKVTNYQLSERLNELNFDSKTHCGYYNSITREWYNSLGINCYKDPKAYDCYDLLMYMKTQPEEVDFLANGLAFRGEFFMLDYWDRDGKSIGIDSEPQNALASAIIRILEENSLEEGK